MKALEVKNISKIFPDKTKALEDISFSIEQGEFCVIAGSNGSGKSVLMSLIAGLDEPTGGTIDLFGNSAGLVFQDADSQILGETPEEDVSFGAKNYGLKKDELKQCVESSLEQVGLLHKKNAYARSLSGGEKRRLNLCRILMEAPNVLILDEPTRGIDVGAKYEIYCVINDLAKAGKAVIVISSEMPEIIGTCDRTYVINEGQIAGELSKEELTQEKIMQCVMAHNRKGDRNE